MPTMESLIASLELHEGVRDKPYKDSVGILTIGVGHNLERPISPAAIRQILMDDINDCTRELDRALPDWRSHDNVRQNVLVEMVFNLGMPRLLKFKNFMAHLSARNYKAAAGEMLNSTWATQVGKRARTLAAMMEGV